jgi:hypothetical protein
VNGTVVNRYPYEGSLGPSAEINASGQVTTRYVYGLQPNVPEYMVRAGAMYRLVLNEQGRSALLWTCQAGRWRSGSTLTSSAMVTLNTNPDFPEHRRVAQYAPW